jgi:hypothetical protein
VRGILEIVIATIAIARIFSSVPVELPNGRKQLRQEWR